MTSTFLAKVTEFTGQIAVIKLEAADRHAAYAEAREKFENDFSVHVVSIWQDSGHDIPPWADQPLAWWTYDPWLQTRG